MKAALALDGRIETAQGASKWITSAAARSLSRRMRRDADAILVGVDTIIADNPRLTADTPSRNPLRVILDGRLRTPPKARVFSQPGRTLLVSGVKANGRYLNCDVENIVAKRGKRGLSLPQTLKALAGMGVASMIVEGGSAVHTAFLEENLVDEVRLFIAPKLIGGAKARSFFEGAGLKTPAGLPLHGIRVRRVGPDILVTGRLDSKS